MSVYGWALIVCSRSSLVSYSQEQGLTSKTTMDVQKLTRPTKQYSAVASRYAAPLTSKKPLSNIADGAHGGHANVTKLPFITGTAFSAFILRSVPVPLHA